MSFFCKEPNYTFYLFWINNIVIIPWKKLNSQTLETLIEAFVLREGTDYGEHECSLMQKISDVYCLLENGDAVLVWSELHKTINIILKENFTTNTLRND